MTRSITILGATGSVGTSTLDLVSRDRDAWSVTALTANRDAQGLAKAARAVGAHHAVVADPAAYAELKDALAGTGIGCAAGEDAVVEAAAMGADWTMAAIVGCAGLRPTMAALQGGHTVALANKEALVSAGDVMMAAARAGGATLLPVDSEHNAVFQCLTAGPIERVESITLTASGGPFRDWSRAAMAQVTPAQAVKHPNWSMGAKISVDSATMMNKGLELIEAFHLFPVGADRLQVLVHPQSIVHALVRYADGSVLAHMGPADMRVPIAHALAWPGRMATPMPALDLAALGTLRFEAPDEDRFPALALARQAMAAGRARPAVLNAANERAVAAFLDGRLAFLDIAAIVAETLSRFDPPAPSTLDEVIAIDREARAWADGAMEDVLV